MSDPKSYSLRPETAKFSLKGHDATLRVANTWAELARALLDADRVTITDPNFANQFLSKNGAKADLKSNDTLVLEKTPKRTLNETLNDLISAHNLIQWLPSVLPSWLVAIAILIVAIIAFYVGEHQSETAILVGGGVVVILVIGTCILFWRLGQKALKGSGRVEIRSKWSIGKIANGEFELIRDNTKIEIDPR